MGDQPGRHRRDEAMVTLSPLDNIVEKGETTIAGVISGIIDILSILYLSLG